MDKGEREVKEYKDIPCRKCGKLVKVPLWGDEFVYCRDCNELIFNHARKMLNKLRHYTSTNKKESEK
jgi:uncharacterized paraquat-inducible protein A